MNQITVPAYEALRASGHEGHEGHVMPPASKPPAAKPGKDKPAAPPGAKPKEKSSSGLLANAMWECDEDECH